MISFSSSWNCSCQTTDPNSPDLIGTYNTAGTQFDVFVNDDLCYLAKGDEGIDVVNVSDPYNPELIHNIPADNSYNLKVRDGLIYAICNNNLQIYDHGYDYDEDGIPDGKEINVFFTDPDSNDTDTDKLTDFQEIYEYFTNPLQNDTDDDFLDDYEEIFTYFTDPNNSDSDSDGLLDGNEISIHITNPLLNDTDSDEMSDGWEVQYGLDPNSNIDKNLDEDDDLLENYLEFQYSTNVLELNKHDMQLLSKKNLFLKSIIISLAKILFMKVLLFERKTSIWFLSTRFFSSLKNAPNCNSNIKKIIFLLIWLNSSFSWSLNGISW